MPKPWDKFINRYNNYIPFVSLKEILKAFSFYKDGDVRKADLIMKKI